MTIPIIGTGGIGSVIARRLASGGDPAALERPEDRWRGGALAQRRPFVRFRPPTRSSGAIGRTRGGDSWRGT
jgi:hypothetical protein